MPNFLAGRSYFDDANTPYGLDISAIAREIGTLQGVKNVHHVPLWCITKNDIHFEIFMDVADDMKVSDTCMIKRNIGNLLEEKFNINHIILQFESNACDDISLDRQSKDRQFGRH